MQLIELDRSRISSRCHQVAFIGTELQQQHVATCLVVVSCDMAARASPAPPPPIGMQMAGKNSRVEELYSSQKPACSHCGSGVVAAAGEYAPD